MSPPLTYTPAYLGLFCALVLAVACNSFLDIQYGSFGTEVFLWAAVFAYTLRVGRQQQGKLSDLGRHRQKLVLLVVALVSAIIFIPMWGFPRAGSYILAGLQAANNCVTVSRRQLHLGLLVSIIMVMFAASHYRADWTMLFYLVPYVAAVVFTLVAEQINRHTEDVRQKSIGRQVIGGQSVAILAATTTILLLGSTLYLLTPQPTLTYLEWRYGQLSRLGFVQIINKESPDMEITGDSAGEPGPRSGAQNPGQKKKQVQVGELGQVEKQNPEQQKKKGQSKDKSEEKGEEKNPPDGSDPNLVSLFPGKRWPSVTEMRAAAKRPGMPHWQSSSINKFADMQQMAGIKYVPVEQALKELREKLTAWLTQHRQEVLALLFAFLVAAFLAALFVFLREIRIIAWIRARFDYLHLGLFAGHAAGHSGIIQYYVAIERFLALYEVQRSPTANAREYLAQVVRREDRIQKEFAEMTILFERARYGNTPISAKQTNRMRQLYRQIYHMCSSAM